MNPRLAAGLERLKRPLRPLAHRLNACLWKGYAKLFLLSDRLGFHLLPKHFYSPVPEIRWLSANQHLWLSPVPMTGVQCDPAQQIQWLKYICQPYYHEVAGRTDRGFGPIESQVLHCFIRKYAPRRIIEIGGGNSTAIMLEAADLNVQQGRNTSQLTSVEPYPTSAFRAVAHRVRHIRDFCQAVPMSVFKELESGDLLFIDSSHSVKVGSDVLRIYLEIVPGLAAGVFLHIHDIFLPFLYPRDALTNFFGWQETSLVLALLTGNTGLEILACLSQLHYENPEALKAVLADYEPEPSHYGLARGRGHFPSSLWLRITR